MKKALVIARFPEKVYRVIINTPLESTIYDIIKIFEETSFKPEEVELPRVRLVDIINIHNIEGIGVGKVNTLSTHIRSGKQVFKDKSGIPNIRIARSHGQLVLFDGHHTLLAYMDNGAQHLNDIPYLLIEPLDEKEVLTFSGIHSSQLNDGGWKTRVIDWKTPNEEKIYPRAQKNIGDLFRALKPLLKH